MLRWLLLLSLVCGQGCGRIPAANVGESVDLVDVFPKPVKQTDSLFRVAPNNRVRVNLAYSTTANFLKEDVYGEQEDCFLAIPAAKKFATAQKYLAKKRKDVRFLVFDCVRPVSVQVKMWNIVKGTKQEKYVGNPHRPVKSLHNYGCAVDLSLETKDGVELDMGTPFDYFGPLAEPQKEEEFLQIGTLTEKQVLNRRLLREVMVEAGFRVLPEEWWHFSCMPGEEARRTLPLVR